MASTIAGEADGNTAKMEQPGNPPPHFPNPISLETTVGICATVDSNTCTVVLKATLTEDGVKFRTHLISADHKQEIILYPPARDVIVGLLKTHGEDLVPTKTNEVIGQPRLSAAVTAEGAMIKIAQTQQQNDSDEGYGTFNFDRDNAILFGTILDRSRRMEEWLGPYLWKMETGLGWPRRK